MAKGSRRTSPTAPVAAAVVSDPIVAALYTPSAQLVASTTSGMVSLRRAPKMNAEIGTPSGLSHSGSSDGHCVAATVKRALGCAALRPQSGVHDRPCQSMRCGGGSRVMPSHHTSPSSVSATLVKITLALSVSMALGFDSYDVPGATPKYPASGLIAWNRPSAAGLIQAMSSPIVVTFQPSKPSGGINIAKFVLPQALGEPALVAAHHRGNAQREALLAQQRVAPIAGTKAPDLARLGKVHDVFV